MEEQFNKAVKEAKTISKWRELEVEKIYKIVNFLSFEGQYGEAMKLTLSPPDSADDSVGRVGDGSDKLITVWAPNRVRETLEANKYTHIRSNGLTTSKSGSKYWSFDVADLEIETPSNIYN